MSKENSEKNLNNTELENVEVIPETVKIPQEKIRKPANKKEVPKETNVTNNKMFVDLAKGKEKTIEDAAKKLANNDIKVIPKKPVYKSVTVSTSLMTIVGMLIVGSSLLVKPAEQIIEHGHLKYGALVPGIAYFVLLQGFVLFGRIRKGDLTLGS